MWMSWPKLLWSPVSSPVVQHNRGEKEQTVVPQESVLSPPYCPGEQQVRPGYLRCSNDPCHVSQWNLPRLLAATVQILVAGVSNKFKSVVLWMPGLLVSKVGLEGGRSLLSFLAASNARSILQICWRCVIHCCVKKSQEPFCSCTLSLKTCKRNWRTLWRASCFASSLSTSRMRLHAQKSSSAHATSFSRCWICCDLPRMWLPWSRWSS